MKSYPKILSHRYDQHIGDFCIAFDKLDGSNIRVEWDFKSSKKNKSNGFTKFGTRTQLINESDNMFGGVPELFMNAYSENLDRIFRSDTLFRGAEQVTAYLEFYGENSFAGAHEQTDEKKLTLIDTFIYKKDFVNPKDFVKTFKNVGIPNVIYTGEFSIDLINDIYNNKYNLKEGIVAKGVLNKRVWMNKAKTENWLNKVKNTLGEERFKEEL